MGQFAGEPLLALGEITVSIRIGIVLTAKLSVIRDGFELSCPRNIDHRRQHKRVSFPKIKTLKVLLETNPRRGHDRFYN